MPALVDLHLHTTTSDGRLSPTALVELAAKRGLRVIAVTDHDTTDGLQAAFEAAKAFPSLTVIPGIELGTDIPKGEIHLLGLFIRYQDPPFQETLARLRDSRIDRAKRMVEKLATLNMPLKWERVLAFADGGAVGRPHVARALVEAGYVATQQEAFDKYINRNGPAYAERQKFTPEEAIALVKQQGGIPILCHPAEGDNLSNVDSQLAQLVKAGVMGVEVYYGNYSPETVRVLAKVARKYNLVPCGGSDYHAVGNEGEPEPGQVGPPMESVKRLFELAGEAGRRLVFNAPKGW